MYGNAKAKAGLRAPEDPNNNLLATETDVTNAERAHRIVLNDQENLFTGMIIAWASIICFGYTDVSKLSGHANAHVAMYAIFAAARICHTITYALANQPLRSLSFTLGLAAMLSMAINAIVATFRSQM